MINAISNAAGFTISANQSRNDQNLTDQQRLVVSDTLSQFDVNNLSPTEASFIVDKFNEAGIQPGAALESAVSDSGFDANTIGELAAESATGSTTQSIEQGRPGNRPPPPPKQDSEEVSSISDYVTELLDEITSAEEIEELSREQIQLIVQQVADKFGFEEDQSMINTSA